MRILKKVFLFPLAIAALWFVLSLAMYRIPSGRRATVFEGNVHYQVVELGLTNRDFLESVVYPNRVLARLEGAPELYVSVSDKRKLWPESPFAMDEKGYAYSAKILAPPLLFGGYGVSEVVDVRRVKGAPKISK